MILVYYVFNFLFLDVPFVMYLALFVGEIVPLMTIVTLKIKTRLAKN